MNAADASAARGPASVVALGGGHGLAVTLRALRRLPTRITAVVSVADDGGSSGRLRADADRAAPGDLRKCVVALAGEPSALTRAMEHRFDSGELEDHCLGNLVIAAMEESEGGLVPALDALAEEVSAVGRVLPATCDPVQLVAELADGSEVVGQAEIACTPGVERVRLSGTPSATADAVAAIDGADLVLLGPGSLFTSVLAAAVVPGIAAALSDATARVVYLCNLRPQAGETDGFDVADHVAALRRHGIEVDVVLHDPSCIAGAEGIPGAIAAPLAGPRGMVHDPALLADALADLLPNH